MITRELITRLGFTVNDSKLKQYEKSTNNIKRNAEDAANSFRNMFAAFAGFQAVKSLAAIADQMQSIEARIGMLPQTVSSSGEAFDTVANRANNAKQSIDAYASFYVKAGNATQDFITDQEKLLKVVDGAAFGLAASGAEAVAQKQAFFQLGQAIGSPAVQMEEMNTLIDVAPDLFRALGKAIPGAEGNLKKFISTGKVTGKMLAEGLIAVADQFEEKMKSMPMTIGQATTIMGNRWAVFVNRLNRESSAVTKIADMFLTGFDKIESGLNSMVKFFGGATNTLKFFAIAITALILPALAKLGLGLVASLLTPAGAIVAGLVALGLVLEDVYTWIKGGDSVMGAWLGTWEQFKVTLQEHSAYLKAWGMAIGGVLIGVGIKFGIMAAAAISAAVSAAAAWVAATWPILLIIAAITAVVAAIYMLWKHWDKVMGFVKDVTKSVFDFVIGGFLSMVNTLIDNWAKFKSFFGMGAETTITANGATTGNITSMAPSRAAGVANVPYANAGAVSQSNTFQFQMPPGTTQQQADALKGAVQQNGLLDSVTRQMALIGSQ